MSVKSTSLISVLALIVSVLALFVSAWSAGFFSPFNPQVYIDGYFLPHTHTGSNSQSSNFILGLQIVFSNEGNRKGTIQDVILIVKNKATSKEVIYAPAYEIDFNTYLTGTMILDTKSMSNINFYPFTLDQKENVIKAYIFTLDPANITNFPASPTLEGQYIIKILMKTSNEDYKEYYSFDFTLDKKTIDVYNLGDSIYRGRINFPYSTFSWPKE